jgi:glycine cleavage system H protein
MTKIPKALRYTKTHEWVRIEKDEKVVIGITDYAQSKLLDIVYTELPDVGKEVTRNEPLGAIESVKAVNDFYSPLSGTVIELNKKVQEAPELINKDPYGKGWLVVLKPKRLEELEELLTAEQYEEVLKEEE